MVDRIMVPKDTHLLTPRTCECLPCFADVIKDIKMGRVCEIIQMGPT